jgi:GMP synthase (glutamine-hydrolysing)
LKQLKGFLDSFLFLSAVFLKECNTTTYNTTIFLLMQHNVLILDFGSQYTQLIARRVRELNIFCEIFPYNHFPDDLSTYKAVILSGSPYSVRAEDAPHPDLSQIRGKMPLLAVCYGAQYLAIKMR